MSKKKIIILFLLLGAIYYFSNRDKNSNGNILMRSLGSSNCVKNKHKPYIPTKNYNTESRAMMVGALTPDEKKAALDALNATRNNLTPLPPAQTMPKLVWDDKLEELAQNYANTCPTTHNASLPDDTGENLAWGYPNLVAAIKGWDDEKKNINAPLIKKNGTFIFNMAANGPQSWCIKGQCGHFTQNVWAKTTRVGCARPTKQCKDWGQNVYVCNYAPAGNWIGEPVYKVQQ